MHLLIFTRNGVSDPRRVIDLARKYADVTALVMRDERRARVAVVVICKHHPHTLRYPSDTGFAQSRNEKSASFDVVIEPS